jgi:hypothetical protein
MLGFVAFVSCLPAVCGAQEPRGGAGHVGPVRLERIISREHPSVVHDGRLSIGRNGQVYLPFTPGNDGAYVLRIGCNGAGKRGGAVVYALVGVAANAHGIVATANGHFNHTLNLYSPDFGHRGAVADFRVGDDVGYESPSAAEADELLAAQADYLPQFAEGV